MYLTIGVMDSTLKISWFELKQLLYSLYGNSAGLWVTFYPQRDFREIFMPSDLIVVNDADSGYMDCLESKIAPNYYYSICFLMS